MKGFIEYKEGVKKNTCTLDGDQLVSIKWSKDVHQLQVILKPKTEIVLQSMTIELSDVLDYREAIINGYQTWTDSGIFTSESTLKRQSKLLDFITLPFSDYGFYTYKKESGICHSYTYVLLGNDDERRLYLSKDESSCYTIFEMNFNTQKIKIHLDVEGMILKDETVLLDVQCDSGSLIYLKTKYFKEDKKHKVTGWTSWYNYYTNITEEILLNNIANIKEKELPFDIFQIDDGYQIKVGDWLQLKNNFPNGMSYIREKIEEAGLKPGLWLAPFIVVESAQLFKDHPEWVMRDQDGKMVKAGFSPVWKGRFYTLDIYHEGVRTYLKKVFDTVINIWGYKFLKLDFLYALSIVPYQGKSRAAVMNDGINLINELTQGADILGCGVPVSLAKNKFSYCRIGADVLEKWEDPLLEILNYRERISTVNSLKSTLGRSLLNGSWFINDPDVFYLRSADVKMSETQKYTLFVVNALLGGMIFTSDNVSEYTPHQLMLIKSMYPLYEVTILSLNAKNDLYTISFKAIERNYMLYVNLSKTNRRVKIHKDVYAKGALFLKGSTVTINAYQTVVCHMLQLKKDVEFIGSKGHILPLGNLESFENENIKHYKESNDVKDLIIAYKNYELKSGEYVGEYQDYKLIKF